MRKTIIIQIIIIAFMCTMGYASDVGVTGAQFLKIGTGARPMGMGGAFGAVADDGYAAYWNPAGFASLEKREVVSTYLRYFEDINFGYAGYAMPCKDIGVLGFGVAYLAVSDIEGRAGDTEMPDRNFGADDICVTLSYAIGELFKESVPGLDFGVNLKLINQKIDDESASTAALDIGTYYRAPVKDLTLAVVMQNIGPGQRFVKERDPLPLNLKLSAAYRMFDDKMTAAIDIDQYLIDQKMYAGVGCEYWLMKMIALRAGYRYGYHTDSLGNIVGITGGMSFRAFNFQLDYAFVPFGELGDTHRVSFSARF